VVTGTATPRTRLETSNATTVLGAVVANPEHAFVGAALIATGIPIYVLQHRNTQGAFPAGHSLTTSGRAFILGRER